MIIIYPGNLQNRVVSAVDGNGDFDLDPDDDDDPNSRKVIYPYSDMSAVDSRPTLLQVALMPSPIFEDTDDHRCYGLGGLNIGNPDLRYPKQVPPKNSTPQRMFLANEFAEHLATTNNLQSRLRRAISEYPDLLSNDKHICLRLLSCNPAKVLGANFPRIALAHGVVMYRGMWMLCAATSVGNLAQWLNMLDIMSKRYRERRARVHLLCESFLQVKLGPIADKMFSSCAIVTRNIYQPSSDAPNHMKKLVNQIQVQTVKNNPQAAAAVSSFGLRAAQGDVGIIGSQTAAKGMGSTKPRGSKADPRSDRDRQLVQLPENHRGFNPNSSSSVPEQFRNRNFSQLQPVVAEHRRHHPVSWLDMVMPQPDLARDVNAMERMATDFARQDLRSMEQAVLNSMPHAPASSSSGPGPAALAPAVAAANAKAVPALEPWSEGLSCNILVRPISDEFLRKFHAKQYYPYPADLRYPDAKNHLSVTLVETSDRGECAVVRDIRGRFETRKRIILDAPKAVLLREVWAELAMPPVPNKKLELLPVTPEDEQKAGVVSADGDILVLAKYEIGELPWMLQRFIHVAATLYLRLVVSQDCFIATPIDAEGNPIPAQHSDHRVECFARVVHFSDLRDGRTAVWISDHCDVPFIPDFCYRLVESQITEVIVDRATKRNEVVPAMDSGPMLATTECAIETLARQIGDALMDPFMLDRISDLMKKVSWAYDDPNSPSLTSPAIRRERTEFSRYCHNKFIEIWHPVLRKILPRHWSKEIPEEHWQFLRRTVLESVATAVQTSLWTSRFALQCIDFERFWEVFFEYNEVEFGRCLACHRNSLARVYSCPQSIDMSPGGFFHINHDTLSRFPSGSCAELFIDTSCFIEYVEAGNAILDGEKPPGCPFNVNWINREVPGHSIANIFHPGSGVHQVIKHGYLDVSADVMLDKIWASVLSTPPVDVIHVLHPTLYFHEGPNVRYIRVNLRVPWFLRFAARLSTEYICRVERFENMVVVVSNTNGVEKAVHPKSGAPIRSQFDFNNSNFSGLAAVAEFHSVGQHRCMYARATRLGGFKRTTTLPQIPMKWFE